MANCCFGFLFYCSISGVIVFTILAIFTITDNTFLLVENIKVDPKDKKDDYSDQKDVLIFQFIAAAIYDAAFAVLFHVLGLRFCQKKKDQSGLKKKELEIIENDINKNNIIDTNNNNIVNEIIINKNTDDNIADNVIGTKGMSEKDY